MKVVSGVAKSRVVSLGKSPKADAVICPATTRERERDRRLSRRAYFQHIIIYNPDADPVGLELSSTVLVYLVNPVSVWVKKFLQHSSYYTKYLLNFVHLKLLKEKIIH